MMADKSESNSNGKRVAVISMDGSEHSDEALDFYVKHVYKVNDEPIILHCVHHTAQQKYGSIWMPVDPSIVSFKYHEESKKGDEVCQSLKEKLDKYQIEGKVMKIEGGDVGHTVVEKSRELGAALIVVGTRGLGTIRRKILGSVSEYIVHHSHIPVFVCDIKAK